MSYFTEVEAVSAWVELVEIAEDEGCKLYVVDSVRDEPKMFCITIDNDLASEEYYETLEGVAGFFRGLQAARSRKL